MLSMLRPLALLLPVSLASLAGCASATAGSGGSDNQPLHFAPLGGIGGTEPPSASRQVERSRFDHYSEPRETRHTYREPTRGPRPPR